ncbi:MAG: NADH-quinone oxidoreductase subunit C [Planctomycetes bacterium]|nr:NADH-quinone oxidoreductase subunit C [Planctomycetota bacterium]
MTSGVPQVVSAVCEKFPELRFDPKPLLTYSDGRASDQLYIRIPPQDVVAVMRFLRDDPRCKFEQLAELTCVDYLEHPAPPSDERFGVTYGLLSLTHGHRLWIKVFVSDPEPTVPSVTAIWHGAEWLEREVFDLFGVNFSGHPDLRRILCPDWFDAHALRKDYPLTGRGERESFEIVRRDSV